MHHNITRLIDSAVGAEPVFAADFVVESALGHDVMLTLAGICKGHVLGVVFHYDGEESSGVEVALHALVGHSCFREILLLGHANGNRVVLDMIAHEVVDEGLEDVGKVLLNDVEAGDMATECLINNGYRKIEMISYDLDISSISERAEGYRRTMAAHGFNRYYQLDEQKRNRYLQCGNCLRKIAVAV